MTTQRLKRFNDFIEDFDEEKLSKIVSILEATINIRKLRLDADREEEALATNMDITLLYTKIANMEPDEQLTTLDRVNARLRIKKEKIELQQKIEEEKKRREDEANGIVRLPAATNEEPADNEDALEEAEEVKASDDKNSVPLEDIKGIRNRPAIFDINKEKLDETDKEDLQKVKDFFKKTLFK